MEKRQRDLAATSEECLRVHTIGELKPLSGQIVIAEYNPHWPEMFRNEAEKIRDALGNRALLVEHVGSTSVPELVAKPIIDIVLAVADSADEGSYAELLELSGYQLRICEPNWYQHRMFKDYESRVNLHVFSEACPEIARMLTFRNWLRINRADRELYSRTKRSLAQQGWKYIQEYADAKTAVIQQIMSRAR